MTDPQWFVLIATLAVTNAIWSVAAWVLQKKRIAEIMGLLDGHIKELHNGH